MEKIEYRVRPVTRYIVTRFHDEGEKCTACAVAKGEFENERVAYEVAYALCSAEHNQLGWPLDDERIVYPRNELTEASRIG